MSRTGLEKGPRIGSMTFEKPKDQLSTVKRLWHYMQKQRLGIIIAMITVFVATLLKIAGPWLIGYIVDHYIMKLDIQGTISMSLVLGATYVGLFIATYIQTIVIIYVAQKTIQRIRRKLFKKFRCYRFAF